MSIEIRIATTEEEREMIFRFRYDLSVAHPEYVQCNMDHVKRMVVEPADATAVLIGAYENDALVGTVRTNYSHRGGLGMIESMLGMDWACEYHPGRTSVTTKLMVADSHRRSTLAIRLAKFAYTTARQAGIEFDFIFCQPHLIELFQAVGYRSYTGKVSHPVYGEFTPFVLAVSDIEHLASVRSPFLSIAKEFPVNRDAVFFMRSRMNPYPIAA